MRIDKAPRGMTVDSWALMARGAQIISGFKSPEAARAWATEWNYGGEDSRIVALCHVHDATAALATFEAHRQQNEAEGKHWKEGLSPEVIGDEDPEDTAGEEWKNGG